MGHSDWTMIARIYGRWIPEAAPDAGQKAVKIFGQNAGKNAGITAANAGKLMPALELSTDKNQGLNGGEGGIRTRVRGKPKHAFQACDLNHSSTSPYCPATLATPHFTRRRIVE
jgi:hypothetical protein